MDAVAFPAMPAEPDKAPRSVSSLACLLYTSNYADPEYIYRDLEASRALMRRLGCIVVHTEGRAVEETAQEILRYYERSHPSNTDIID